MGDAGGQFAQRRKLFAHDDLVLGFFQVPERRFQLVVLALELVGQFLHQVQALDFEGVAAEDLERGGHFADLVAPADIDLGLQVTLGHAPHAVGQAPKPAREEAPDIDPGQQQRAHDADRADQQQEIAPGHNRIRRSERRLLDAGAGGPHEALGPGHEFDGETAVALQEIPLPAVEGEFPGAQPEHIVRPFAQRDQPRKRRGEPLAQRCGAEPRQAPLNAAGGGFEALAQRFEQRRGRKCSVRSPEAGRRSSHRT